MDLDAYFASHGYPKQTEDFRSGFVTLIGRPNAGKSTLLNTLMGKKIAITSDTAQTTRHRFRAVLNREGLQAIIVDTPGLHKPHDVLGEELNTSALKAIEDVDIVVMMIDASVPVGRGDEWVISHIKDLKIPKICVLSKTDLVNKDALSVQFAAVQKLCTWDSIVALSSVDGHNIEAFIEEIKFFLPKGPAWFPLDIDTDQPTEVLIAEFIREKILRNFTDEVPHAIGVSVEHLDYDEELDKQTIYANIYVEHDSQKGIIIGRGGQAIKTIGTQARADLEELLGCSVYLDLRVKVKKNWRRDASQIKRFGYGEGA